MSSRCRGRLAVRAVAGMLLAFVAILVPIDAPVVPDELGALGGTTTAAAQVVNPEIVDGMPSSCPSPTTESSADKGTCVAETIPCPASPLDSARPMGLSALYVDYCIEHIVNDDALVPDSSGACVLPSGLTLSDCTASTAEYSECPTNSRDLGRRSKADLYNSALWGTVVEVFEAGDDVDDGGVIYALATDFCRISAFRDCVVGLRVGRDTCRHVVRRTWQCPAGTAPLNEWNRCYQESTGVPIGDEPCDAGAPSFPVLSCEDYVGNDFLDDPTLITCSSLAMVDNPDGNDHWCRYDASLLDIDCHVAGATCSPSWSLCFKRASTTGGCRLVQDSLDCAPLQAAFADARRASATPAVIQARLDAALGARCEPCVVLPFQPLAADDCAQDAFGPEASDDSARKTCHEQLFAAAADLNYCGTGAAAPVSVATEQYCSDPAVGRLAWRPTHPTRLAIVGTALVVTVENVPIDFVQPDPTDDRGWKALFEDIPAPSSGLTPAELEAYRASHIYQEFNFVPVAEYAYGSVSLMSNQRSNPRRCRVWQLPRFRVAVRELWPDNLHDEGQIRTLFGAQAVDWWSNLTAQQQQERTEARGLVYVPALATRAERVAELARREADLSEDIMCNVEAGTNAWCRWHPRRPGYYLLIGRGAWDMRAESSIVSDRGISELSEPTADSVSSGVAFGNYTETAPIGIAVHEIRVSTRPASQ